jgi:tripartite-type tricarboxylate transporter receptor subunit TctC
VRLIVAFAAGGPNDILARLIGQWLSDHLGQQFIIENRPGAGGNIGTAVAVNSPPDGYTLLLTSPSAVINASLYQNLNFNLIRDSAPVAGIASTTLIMEVTPSLPTLTGSEFIAYAKANPGRINMASGGNGTVAHVTGELFKMMAGVDMLHVPYRGEAPALTDLISGQVQIMFATPPGSIEHARAGRVRPLAVTAASRWGALPNVPAVAEFLPGYEAAGWAGVVVPKNTPAEIIDKLNREINAALADPGFRARLADLGSVPMAMTPVDFGKLIADETEKWGKVIRAANIKRQ